MIGSGPGLGPRLALPLGTAVLAGAVLLIGLGPGSVAFEGSAADTAGTPVAATDDAYVADLQTRVADLSTRVAELGGADVAELEGRLGGSRSGFDARFGAPVAYLGGGTVQYEVPEIGRVSVTFVDGIAQQVTAVPPRPAGLPLEEPDPADWSLARAGEVAAELVPADATLAESGAAAVPEAGSSAILGQATTVTDEAGCVVGSRQSFSIAATAPNEESVSSLALALDTEAAALAATEPERGGRSNRSASAVVNQSLGGVASVNGLVIQTFDLEEGVEGARPPAPGQTLVAVELAIENGSRRAARFAESDFLLVDAEGREVSAICGGAEPAIVPIEIGRGDSVEGWVTFQVPEDFVPERFVILAPGARVGYELG